MSTADTTTPRAAILALIGAGWTTERIAVRLRVTESAVRSWRDRGTQPRRLVAERLAALVAQVVTAEARR